MNGDRQVGSSHRPLLPIKAEDFEKSMEILNEDPEHNRWNQAHSHFFESALSPTSGETDFTLIPEVFRFEASR